MSEKTCWSHHPDGRHAHQTVTKERPFPASHADTHLFPVANENDRYVDLFDVLLDGACLFTAFILILQLETITCRHSQ